MTTKKESAPGLDGIPYSLYSCAGSLGSQFLYNAYKHVLEGGTIPALFAESRAVFIPKTYDIDNGGRIVRSPEALRPLTLCNCDCKILTAAICRGLHWYTIRCIHPPQRCISSRQMTDNIFEIETTALAHVACAPQGSGLIERFCCCISQCQSLLDLPCTGKTELPEIICRFLRKIILRQHHARGICRNDLGGSSSWAGAASCLRWLLNLSLDGFRMRSFQGILMAWIFYSRLSVRMLTTSLWLPHLFET